MAVVNDDGKSFTIINMETGKTRQFVSESDFQNGVCAICWTVYPDGRYFADEDGYGMEDNNEENVYCIINKDLEIIVPFQPMNDVGQMLKKYER